MKRIDAPFFPALVAVALAFIGLASSCAVLWEPDPPDALVGAPAEELFRVAMEIVEANPEYALVSADPEQRRLVAARQIPYIQEPEVDLILVEVGPGPGAEETELRVRATREPADRVPFEVLASAYGSEAYVAGPRAPTTENDLLNRIRARLGDLGFEARSVYREALLPQAP